MNLTRNIFMRPMSFSLGIISRLFHCSVIKELCVCRISDSSFILSKLFAFVKNFFTVFFTLPARFCGRSFATACIYYHGVGQMSTTFFQILQSFFHVKEPLIYAAFTACRIISGLLLPVFY
jgi:hypothetical protein